MTEQPSPAAVPAGHVVRVQVFREFVFSPPMSPGEAAALAEQLAHDVGEVSGTWRLVPFTAADGCTSRLRARQVVDITNGPASVLRRAVDAPVHVHLHMGTSTPAAEAAVRMVQDSFVPTPTVLAGRRQPR